MNIKSIFAVVIVVIGAGLSYPSPALQEPYKISSIRDTKKSWPVHIYYAKDKDSLPESFEVIGTVLQYTRAVDCGDMIFGSTVRIRPTKKIAGYGPEFVYVVVFCLSENPENLIGKAVKLHVKKLYAGNTPCECNEIHNHMDSNGIPFYCAGGLTILPD